ncbi:MAG: hypothetical protein VXZ73_02510 [Pseudomonadota bacterium]|nr:hypothetical protein [Pseudomonadota bacterium]MEC8978341.1 hypothetical protein [Pseudomonadota bacterium]
MPSFSHLYLIPNTQQKKHRSMAIHSLAQQLCARHQNTTFENIALKKTHNGKPHFYNQDHPVDDFHCSISHNKDHSILATSSHPIAIDTEICKPRPQLTKLHQKMSTVFQIPTQPDMFYPLWTLLEAWCKHHNLRLWSVLKTPIKIPPEIIKTYLSQQPVQYQNMAISQHKPTPESLLCLIQHPTCPKNLSIQPIKKPT